MLERNALCCCASRDYGRGMTSVRQLTPADLPSCAFAGTPTHLRYVARELERAAAGEVDYLVVLDDDGVPVSVGGIDHVEHAGSSSLYQLATDPARQSQGFGTVLVRALEDAARARGVTRVRVGVETGNVRARTLYDRLGYVATGQVQLSSWDSEDEHGRVTRYDAQVVVLVRDV